LDKGMCLWLGRDLPEGLLRHMASAHTDIISYCPTEYGKIKIQARNGLHTEEEKMSDCT